MELKSFRWCTWRELVKINCVDEKKVWYSGNGRKLARLARIEGLDAIYTNNWMMDDDENLLIETYEDLKR